MAYNYVTVSGTFATLTGTVTFTPPNDVTDLTGTIPVLGPGPAVCTVSGGSFTSPALLATDNVGLLPAGWTWLTTVALTGQKAYTYPVLIPAANGTTATLSALAVSASGGGSAEGFNNPMTTLGDVIVGGAGGAAQRLTIGGSAQVLTSNGSGATPTWQATAFSNPMIALGDMIYGGTSPSAGSPARLIGGTVATKQFMTQTGTGSASAAPAWGTIASADMPGATTSTQGAVQLDGTAGDIKAPAIAASAGSGTLAAISTHVHPLQDPLALGQAQTHLPWGTMGVTASTASAAWYQRLLSGGYTISNITLSVGTSAGSISLGAYQTSGAGINAKPAIQLATTGALAMPATGASSVALGGTITPNLTDWLAVSFDATGGSGSTLQGCSGVTSNIAQGSTYNQTAGTPHPLPGTAGTLVNASNRIWAFRGA